MSEDEKYQQVGRALERFKEARRTFACWDTKVACMLEKVAAVPTGAVITIDDRGHLVGAGSMDKDGKSVRPTVIDEYPAFEDLREAVAGREEARKQMA